MPSPILLPSFVRRGRTRAWKSCKDVPASVLELFAIPGLRPDKILKLYDALGVASLAELEAAAKEDQNLAIAKSGDTQLHLHKQRRCWSMRWRWPGLCCASPSSWRRNFFFAANNLGNEDSF